MIKIIQQIVISLPRYIILLTYKPGGTLLASNKSQKGTAKYVDKQKKMVGNLILKLYINIKYQYIAQEIVVTQLLEF